MTYLQEAHRLKYKILKAYQNLGELGNPSKKYINDLRTRLRNLENKASNDLISHFKMLCGLVTCDVNFRIHLTKKYIVGVDRYIDRATEKQVFEYKTLNGWRIKLVISVDNRNYRHFRDSNYTTLFFEDFINSLYNNKIWYNEFIGV